MMGLQFASNPQYFKKYIRGYEEGLEQEYEDQDLPPEEEPNFILINIEQRAIPYGLRPDGVPSPLAAKLWTRILADSDVYVPNSSIVATSLIDLGIPNPIYSDRRSSLNYVYKLVGPIYINGVQVDLEEALRKGLHVYKGMFNEDSLDPTISKAFDTVMPMISETMSNLVRDRKPYPIEDTIPS